MAKSNAEEVDVSKKKTKNKNQISNICACISIEYLFRMIKERYVDFASN